MNSNRAYYIGEIKDFIEQSNSYILGELAKNNKFDLSEEQRNTWQQEISLLKNILKDIRGTIVFEYNIPRIGKRIDVVLLINSVAYIIEFKCGEYYYNSYAIEQVMDYALDLKYFHKESHNLTLVPILIATNAPAVKNEFKLYDDNVFMPNLCNSKTINEELLKLLKKEVNNEKEINPYSWIESDYSPTPTIIEAAQALYNNHSVVNISRNDAGAKNLHETANAIDEIINNSKAKKQKSICFITGVPGAGKTLAGLNIACNRHIFEEEEHAVFLSGNGPLVEVLQEALARDELERTGIRKGEALRKTKSFIQIIHHFRDDAIRNTKAPLEKVIIFDEAQRAWDKQKTSKFMQKEKGVANFNKSEPEFLIEVMDRHQDWAVIICLVGGGQEINEGEAGLQEWFNALNNRFSNWNVYLSNMIEDSEYCPSGNLNDQLKNLKYSFNDKLHLNVSMRSFRSEKLADFVKALLDVNIETAKSIYKELMDRYPIVLTRDLEKAKQWVKSKARGTERYGIIASSGAKRLRKEGIWVQNKVNAVNWFLNGKTDVRSSYYLEETATEFDIQGLELDFSIVAWDANFGFEGGKFTYHFFKGNKWENINKESDRNYLKNAYRVLLTRARQGMVIYVPLGDINDWTRRPSYYNGIYNYLRNIGIRTLDEQENELFDINESHLVNE